MPLDHVNSSTSPRLPGPPNVPAPMSRLNGGPLSHRWPFARIPVSPMRKRASRAPPRTPPVIPGCAPLPLTLRPALRVLRRLLSGEPATSTTSGSRSRLAGGFCALSRTCPHSHPKGPASATKHKRGVLSAGAEATAGRPWVGRAQGERPRAARGTRSSAHVAGARRGLQGDRRHLAARCAVPRRSAARAPISRPVAPAWRAAPGAKVTLAELSTEPANRRASWPASNSIHGHGR